MARGKSTGNSDGAGGTSGPNTVILGETGGTGGQNSGSSPAADKRAGDGTVIIDIASPGATGDSPGSGDSAAPKRRGRPRGSKNKSASASKAVGLDSNIIASTLFSIHAGLAALTATPELALQPEESESIAKAVTDVSQFYDLSTSAKTMAWTQLTVVVAMTYGPRFIVARQRLANEREERRKANPMQPQAAPAKTNGAAAPSGIIPGTNYPIQNPPLN